MKNTLLKRFLAMALTLCLVLGMCPVTAFAAEGDTYAVGDTKTISLPKGETAEEPEETIPDDTVWALTGTSDEWLNAATGCVMYEHQHSDSCYYKSCDHKDGHVSSCYSESTSYALCEHTDDSAHSGTVTLADVVTINGTSATWKTDHPAYSAVYAVYKAAYDEAYASAKYFKDAAGKAAGVGALVGKTFCYTVSASAEPDLCEHVCSEVGGSCYTKTCVLTEHTHTDDCYYITYTWTLCADANKNDIADKDETFAIVYEDGLGNVLETFENVAWGTETPAMEENPTRENYAFGGWTPEVAETVSAPSEGNTITYTAKWVLNPCYITVNGDVTATNTDVPVDSQSEVSVVLTPNEGKYITGVTLDGEAYALTPASYSETKVTVTFTTGTAVNHAIEVVTADASVSLKSNVLSWNSLMTEEETENAILSLLSNDGKNEIEVVSGMITIEYLAYEVGETTKWADIGESFSFLGIGYSFGDEETETIKVTYAGSSIVPAFEQTFELTLSDDRTETTITLNEGTTFTYSESLTEEEIYNAVFASLTSGEETLDKEVTMEIDNLNAGTHTVTFKFAGDNIYAASSASTEITINKAVGSISVGSATVKYGEGTPVSVSGLIDSGAADRIEFVVGAQLGESAGTDAGAVAIVNFPAIIDVDAIEDDTLRSLAQLALNSLSSGTTVSLSQLSGYLGGVLDTLNSEEFAFIKEYINLDTESISALVSVLENVSEMEDLGELTVKVTFGEDISLSDAGVYVVGGVVSDANYETAYGINYVIITPDGAKLELAWNEKDANGLYVLKYVELGSHDLGASIVTEYEKIEGADPADRLKVVFIGVNINGEMTVTENVSDLTYGTYTEIAYIRDLGNQMYYAEPLVRQVTIVSDLVDVKFVDESVIYTWEEGVERSMTAVVYDKDGNKLSDAEQAKITYNYYGIESDGDIYTSTTGAEKPGTYTVTATYMDQAESPSAVGAAVGVMVIQPQTASVSVESVTRTYEEGVTTSLKDLITKSPADAKMAVMVAGIADMGDFSEQGLAAVTGEVYIDFPDRVDTVIKSLNIPTELTASQLKGYLDKIEDALAQAGVESEELTTFFDKIRELDGEVTIAITDLSGYTFEHIGAWVVVAGIMDNDYYPAVDTGLVVITPEVTEYTLHWNYTDSNNIITRPVLDIEGIDLLAHAENADGETVDADILYYVVGVTEDGEAVEFYGSEAEIADQLKGLSNGIYTEYAYLYTKLDANMIVAEPIMRTILLVNQTVTVIAPDVIKTYGDDTDYASLITVTPGDGTEAVEGALTVYYTGIDAVNGTYSSTEQPTNVGVYAVYAEYKVEENGELKYFGCDVGTLTIQAAALIYDIKDTTVTYNGQNQKPEITCQVADVHDILFIVDTQNGTVNLVMPEYGDDIQEALGWDGDLSIQYWLEKLEETIDQLNSETGVDAKEVVSNLLSNLPEEITGSELYGELYALVTDIDSNKLTLNDPYPVNVGKYNVYGIAFKDVNHILELSKGTLTIDPAQIIVTMPSYEIEVGDEMPDLNDYTVTGIVEGEEVTVEVTPSCDAENTDTAGTYTITAEASCSDSNYVVTVVDGTLTISEAEEEDKDDNEGKYPIVFPNDDAPGVIYIDGLPVDTDSLIESSETTLLATSYVYKTGKNAHESYPIHMYVWELTLTDTDGDGKVDTYIATRVEELDDFLTYKGTSIRVNFTSNGIRFFTQVPSAARSKLVKGTLLSGNLKGFKLVEYGTVFAWADKGDVVKSNGGVSYAYISGSRDSIFSQEGDSIWYTGMLTELGDDAETLDSDLLARPYFVLQRTNADGTTSTFTLYGGQIQRSIYYVAKQNQNHWESGTAYDNYIEDIIATVEKKA